MRTGLQILFENKYTHCHCLVIINLLVFYLNVKYVTCKMSSLDGLGFGFLPFGFCQPIQADLQICFAGSLYECSYFLTSLGSVSLFNLDQIIFCYLVNFMLL